MSKVDYKYTHDIAFWDFDNGLNSPVFLGSDFHLIPKSRPYISLPRANIVTVRVPNSSSIVNETKYLPGQKTYSERSGKWDFYIDHNEYTNWVKSFKDLRDYIHGKHLYVSLLDEPNGIYEGRFIVNGYTPESDYTSISIEYNINCQSVYEEKKQTAYFRIRFINEYGVILQESNEKLGTIPRLNEITKVGRFIVKGYNKNVTSVIGNTDYYVYGKTSDEDHIIGLIETNLVANRTSQHNIYYVPKNMQFLTGYE